MIGTFSNINKATMYCILAVAAIIEIVVSPSIITLVVCKNIYKFIKLTLLK